MKVSYKIIIPVRVEKKNSEIKFISNYKDVIERKGDGVFRNLSHRYLLFLEGIQRKR